VTGYRVAFLTGALVALAAWSAQLIHDEDAAATMRSQSRVQDESAALPTLKEDAGDAVRRGDDRYRAA
jgi:hypothetical protein